MRFRTSISPKPSPLPKVPAIIVVLSTALAPAWGFAGECSFNGKKLYGKVQVVNSYPDLKIQKVQSFPDLKVQWVNSFPDSCGKWQKVENFPDLKIQFVENFPDLKVQFVQNFPGMP